MTARTVETAGEGGGHGDGLPGSAGNGDSPPGSACIIACERHDARLLEPENRLQNSGIVIDLSERSAAVVGRRPSGKSWIRSNR